MKHIPRWGDRPSLLAAGAAILLFTTAFRAWLHLTNPTIAALGYLLIVLLTATVARLRAAVVVSVVADLCLNYFFMPPFGTFTIADPQNWVALFAFVAVSVVASSLSSAVRTQALEVTARRDELARLFDLSRDVLLTTDSGEAIGQLARFVARRFDLDFAAICLPKGGGWAVHRAGTVDLALDGERLSEVFAAAERTLEFDANARTYSGHQRVDIGGRTAHLVPLRFGTKAVGLLAASGRAVEEGTLDALAGVAAIAIERAQFLEERKAAELARKSEELKSALLASLGHDLRTPLTAIRVAASNLQASWLPGSERQGQSDVILTEVDRLQRLFQNILEMARIDAGAVSADVRWVHPQEIVEAARDQVELALRRHPVDVRLASDATVQLDPRLTAAALAQVLENAARYSASGSPIAVDVDVSADGLTIAVRDRGPGIASTDLPHLFERFYRGAESKRRVAGTGMGLAIARGLLAAERGRIWADNCPEGGARLTMVIPAARRPATPLEYHVMTKPVRILLVDDEVSIQRAVAPLLRSRGYEVEVAGTGEAALKVVASRPPDLVVLDLGLPDLDGTEVCRRMRLESPVPIIVLSARGAQPDKVDALELGADDYVTKPFGPDELIARIRVALRRVPSSTGAPSGRFRAGDLTIDYDRHRVLLGDDEIRLTPKEFDLLELLARNADRVLTHRAILKAVWGPHAVDQPEHLWVLMAQLRKKIEADPSKPKYLLSEPWVGYRFATGDSTGVV